MLNKILNKLRPRQKTAKFEDVLTSWDLENFVEKHCTDEDTLRNQK